MVVFRVFLDMESVRPAGEQSSTKRCGARSVCNTTVGSERSCMARSWRRSRDRHDVVHHAGIRGPCHGIKGVALPDAGLVPARRHRLPAAAPHFPVHDTFAAQRKYLRTACLASPPCSALSQTTRTARLSAIA